MAVQKMWTRICPLFKWEFAALSDEKLIVDSLANLAHRPGENPRKFLFWLEKLFNVLHENYTSYRVKPERKIRSTSSRQLLHRRFNQSNQWQLQILQQVSTG